MSPRIREGERPHMFVRIGDDAVRIDLGYNETEVAVRAQLASMAATIAAGIEALPDKSDEWELMDTVKRSLRIAVLIMIATRSV